MPISPQGSRSRRCIHLSLTTPNAPSSHGRGPFPQLLSKPASSQSAHLLVTLTSHLLSSLPPATMPAYILTPIPAPLSPPPMAKEELVAW